MKRPGRRGKPEDAERSESEELARARRERARRARGELAAKAKGDDTEGRKGAAAEAVGEDDEKAADSRDEGTAKGKGAARKLDGEGPEAKGAEGSKRSKDRKKSMKPKGRRRRIRGPVADESDGERPRRGSRKPADGDQHARRKRAKRLRTGAVAALKQGATETRTRARKATPGVAKGALALLATVFGYFFAGLGILLGLLIAVYRFAAGPLRNALQLGHRGMRALSRAVTPVRVLALVVAGALVLLALSQFADYRTISIGNDAYSDGIQTVAPAPVRETADTGSAHSYLPLPLAGVSLLILALALRGRWRLCRLIALAGIAVIAVGLIHDRPTGLDPGEEAVAFTGVKATLVGGFYAQLFAGLLLTLSALLLGRELKLAHARGPARASRSSKARRRLQRRNQPVEGARA